jgi:hypothetical protein
MHHLRSARYCAGFGVKLSTTRTTAIAILGELNMLLRRAKGTPVALGSRFLYCFASLSMGNIRCPNHTEDAQIIEVFQQNMGMTDLMPPKSALFQTDRTAGRVRHIIDRKLEVAHGQ